MGKKYLFTPVGNTDPIKYFHDGSMLHICRHYKPDIIYMYLSKEMMDNQKKDNRYIKTLELLSELMNHPFQIHVIENENMIDVQQYDTFYHEFREIIGNIEKEMEKEDALHVNMASGTPAMKSALLVMATLAEYRFTPIQVSTPKKKGNDEFEERAEYDVETNWELNEDNEKGAENRCQEVKCMNLVRLLKIDIIKKHLLSYDYRAALEVGEDIKDDLSKTAYCWLKTAAARSVLDWEKMNRVLPEGNGILKNVNVENRKKVLFEYTLVLDLKVRRGEYADFVRAITPLGIDLLELVLLQYCDIEIERYYYYDNRNTKKWNRSRLEGTELLRQIQGDNTQFRYGVVYSSQLNNIVQANCGDALMARRIQEFVDVEHSARNIAAHSIVSVTDEWVKAQTGKSVSEIMWLVKDICERVRINVRKENWDSYDRMNERIIEELDRC